MPDDAPIGNGHDDELHADDMHADDLAPRSSEGGNPARTTAIVVGIALAGLIALFAFGGPEADDEQNRLLGRRVPAMTAQAIDGRDFDIDAFRGQWVLVNFFATWCGPCVVEHPELVALETWGQENGRLELVSIAFNENPETVQAFFDERGGSWPVLDDAATSVEFQISQIPESFLIAPSGLVFRHYVGGIEADPVIAEVLANE